MKTLLCISTLLAVVFALSSTAHAIEKPSIDLSKGTLNGRAFYTLTMKDILTLLGKPSHQSKETAGGIVSTEIVYQDLGLMAQVTSDMNTCRILLIDTTGKAL